MEEKISVNGSIVFVNDDPVSWYDEKGILVGEGTLDEAIKKGYFVRSAHVWLITPSGHLYFQQRSLHVLNNPGKWGEAGGGYVDLGATSLETAVCEIEEELGLSIPKEKYEHLGEVKQFETRFDHSTSKQLVDVYLAVHDFDDKDIILDTRDVKGGKFIEWRKFAEMLKNKEIDFVDHPAEIKIVMDELEKRYGIMADITSSNIVHTHMMNHPLVKKCCNPDVGLLIIRLGLGAAFISHGWDKIQHIHNIVGFFATLGLPAFVAYLVAYLEFIGGIALVLGVCARFFATLIAIDMLFAIILVSWKMAMTRGFPGMETEFVFLTVALGLAIIGAGRYALVTCKKWGMKE